MRTTPGGASLLFLLLAITGIQNSRGQLVINEIMYHPAHHEGEVEPTEEEYLEIHNASASTTISLSGYSLNAGVNFTFPVLDVPAGGYVVVASDPVAFATKYPGVTVPVMGPWTGRLSNSGETIRLVNAVGNQVDELTYSDQGDWADRRRGPMDEGHQGWVWATAADGGGGALELRNPRLTNKMGQNWLATAPFAETPGAVNGGSSNNIAPLIREVRHSPAIPTSSDFVTVVARLTDESSDGLSATVFYREASMTPGAFVSLAMADNAVNGDGDAGDGVFGATLPAFADGAVVEFYVEASDGVNLRTWPAPTDGTGGQGANALYQVEDAPMESDQGLSVYRVILSESEEDEFAFANFDERSNAMMNATFIARLHDETTVRYLAGIRRRGAGSRSANPRTFRLELPGDRPWQGSSKLNLNARYGYLQVFGQKLFAEANLPSALARSMELFFNADDQANGSEILFGAYAHLESQGGESVSRQFPNDDSGNLYRKRLPDSEMMYRSGDVSQYLGDGWEKSTNRSGADWSDLDAWLAALNDGGNPAYLANLEVEMDVDQWLRWFGVMAMLNSQGPNPSTGVDADYFVYFGNADRRARIVPHDLDSILGLGDGSSTPTNSIYDMIEQGDSLSPLVPLIRHPEVMTRYHQALRDLIAGPFSKESFDELIQNCLGTRIPEAEITGMIAFMDARRSYVLSVVDPALSVVSDLPVVGGFPTSSSAKVALSGVVNLSEARTVRVNGELATVDFSDGSWSFGEPRGTGPDIVHPGVNRVLVEAFDEHGDVVETTSLDIWYDDGDTMSHSGTLVEDLTLAAAAGPHLINGDLVIPSGVILTVEPGASLFFAQGVRLTINGRLAAEGTKYNRIRFSVNPGSGDTWDGLYFIGSQEDNRLTHVDQAYSSAASHSVEVDDARLYLESVRWSGTTETILEISNPKLDVVRCNFPSSSGEEVIHGDSLVGDEYFNLLGNVFQTSSGYNDIIDFSGGRRPGPIIYVIGNVFTGGTDDCLDFDGIDAHIEGNVFRNIHTDDPQRPSTSNAIATDGDAHITVVRNIFDDVDHALLLKNDADAIFENNVVHRATLGAISFREPLRSDVDAGSDVTCRGNIFLNNAVTFRFSDHPRSNGNLPVIVADRNILPVADHSYGAGNVDLPPGFVDLAGDDFRLLPGSPAIRSGINGADMGAMVPRGATVSGEPPAVTHLTNATLTVHMPGISGLESGSFVTEYRWRVNGGAWSGEVDIATPIVLTSLADGDHTVEVVGKDSAGRWQPLAEANSSKTWTVNSSLPAAVRINEVLADSSSGSDWIELYHPGPGTVDLQGVLLTDQASGVGGFQFTEPTPLAAGEYLRVYADDVLVPGEHHASFKLNREGEGVYLFASSANGGGLLDSVEFGPQVGDYSLARVGHAAEWGLGVPTPLAANVRAATGDQRLLRINEWVAFSSVVNCDDFVELYHPGSLPVNLGGLYLSDNPSGVPDQFEIPELSFIPGGGFVAFLADGVPEKGGLHTSLRLNAGTRGLALYDADLNEIDFVAFTDQANDAAYARNPNGGETIVATFLPTPGMSNGANEGATTVVNTTLVGLGDTWNYDDSGTDLGMTWRSPFYDDSTWSVGAGLFGFESATVPAPGLQTVFTDPDNNVPFIPTYYFRKEFTFTGDPNNTVLTYDGAVDDGVVVYLNGEELYRFNIEENPSYGTFADEAVGDAGLSGAIVVPSDDLVQGVNVLAVEVHQVNSGSSDVVFGMSLTAAESIFTPSDDTEYLEALALLENLRITELMYDPAGGSDLEFIELQNVGSEALSIGGVRFVDGIEFIFPEMDLGAGEFVILVANQAAFEAEYGMDFPVVGEFGGKLSNGGEELVLRLPAPFSANIQKFTYNDDWYPLTDGGGPSLEIIDPSQTVTNWGDPQAWRPGAMGGTPGGRISLSAGNGQVIVISQSAVLNGGLLGNWSPNYTWTQLEGPAQALIATPQGENSQVSFTAPGTYLFELSGAGGGTVLTSRTTVAVDDRYLLWAARNGLTSGELDDEDGDGVRNLLEYAFEMDPNAMDPGLLPGLSAVGALWEFHFTRGLRKSDLRYHPELSDDLKSWTAAEDELVSRTADFEARKYLLPDAGKIFVRVRIER